MRPNLSKKSIFRMISDWSVILALVVMFLVGISPAGFGVTADWMKWGVISGMLLVFIIASILLTFEVTVKSADLAEKNARLEEEARRRRLVEENLRESERNYRLIVEHQNDLIIKFDAEKRMTFASPAYCATFGKTRQELIGNQFFPLVHEDDQEQVRASLKKLLVPPHTCAHEERAKTVRGWRRFAWSNRAMVNERGEIEEIIAVGRDVTARKQAEDALRESEEKFRKLFNEAIDGIALADAETGIILDCNRAMLKMVGREKTELIGQHQKILHPSKEHNGRFSKTFERHRREENGLILEAHVITKSGDIRDVEIKSNILELEGRKVMQGFFRDVTERNRVREKIRMLARFPSENPNPVLRADHGGVIVYANSAGADLLACWGTEAGRPLPDTYRSYVTDALASGEAKTVEEACLDQVFSLTLAPVADAEFVNLYGLNITKRKRIEDELAQYRRHLERLVKERTADLRAAGELLEKTFASLNDAVFVVDVKDQAITMCNRAAERMFGYGADEMIGGSIRRLHVDEAMFDRFRQNVAAALDADGVFHAEYRMRRKDGGVFFSEHTVTEIVDESGRRRGAVSVVRDITGRKEAEKAVARANQAKHEFISNISHELRTPLNHILGFAQVLEAEEGLDAGHKEFIRIIRKSGDHLLLIINDLIDLADIEAGKSALRAESFALMPFLKKVAEIFVIQAEQKGVAFQTHTDPDLPDAIRADPRRLRQILLNLLGNAVKFTAEGGVTFRVMCVDAGAGPARIRFEVKDTGVGVSPDQLKNIFTAFHQIGDKQLMQTEGVGLGLTVSRRLVRLMGSELHAESALGDGSRFWFDLDKIARCGKYDPADAEARGLA